MFVMFFARITITVSFAFCPFARAINIVLFHKTPLNHYFSKVFCFNSYIIEKLNYFRLILYFFSDFQQSAFTDSSVEDCKDSDK